MNTRRFPRQVSEAWPTAADRCGIHHPEQPGPSHWPVTLVVIAAVMSTVLIVWLGGNPHA